MRITGRSYFNPISFFGPSKVCRIMLSAVQSNLREMSIVLASTSPRRRDILKTCNLDFSVLDPNVVEDLEPSSFPSVSEFVQALAKLKAIAGVRLLNKPTHLLIAADTVVTFEGKVLGKPVNREDAISTLSHLSGKMHEVYTGVCMVWLTPEGNNIAELQTFAECTKVFMGRLDAKTIEAYVSTGEPLDKAGSYGVQGIGCSLVERIEGDYFNVVGLPICSICRQIYSKIVTGV